MAGGETSGQMPMRLEAEEEGTDITIQQVGHAKMREGGLRHNYLVGTNLPIKQRVGTTREASIEAQ